MDNKNKEIMGGMIFWAAWSGYAFYLDYPKIGWALAIFAGFFF